MEVGIVDWYHTSTDMSIQALGVRVWRIEDIETNKNKNIPKGTEIENSWCVVGSFLWEHISIIDTCWLKLHLSSSYSGPKRPSTSLMTSKYRFVSGPCNTQQGISAIEAPSISFENPKLDMACSIVAKTPGTPAVDGATAGALQILADSVASSACGIPFPI